MVDFSKRSGKKPTPAKQYRGTNNQAPPRDEFVRIELKAEQTAELREWRENLVDVLEALDKEIQNGYKFTMRWDDYSHSPAVFMFPSEDSDNGGYILSGRGGTVYRALAECLYKHVYVLRGVWATSGTTRNFADDPDW